MSEKENKQMQINDELTPKLNRGGTRSLLIDFARGIAVILMVLGHNIQFGSGSEFRAGAFFDDWLFKFIYSFHMPLFAVLSGYLFFFSMKHDIWALLKKRFQSLVIPVLCWAALLTVLIGAHWIIQDKFEMMAFLKLYVSNVHGIWFVWAIFWSSLFVVLAEKLFGGKLWLYVLILIPMLFETKHPTYTFMYLCFAGGFLFNKYGAAIKEYVAKHYKESTVVAIAIFAVMIPFYSYDSYVYTTGTSPLGDFGISQIGIDIYRWGIGFAGSAAVIMLSKLICDKWEDNHIVNVIAKFGQISLGVYILNGCFFVRVISKLSFTPNIWVWLLETLVSLPLYYLIIYIIKKIPYGNRLLLGGR